MAFRMFYKVLIFLGLLLYAPYLFADGAVSGWCQDGGARVSIAPGQGQSTTTPGGGQPTFFQRTFRSCTVTVYLVGTTTIASIFSDDIGTAKANPFTSSSNGRWFFYADEGSYDVNFSGGGLAAPYTIGDVQVIDTARPQNRRNACDTQFNASNLGGRILLAMNDLPSTGGIVDARCAEGTQALTARLVMNKANVTVLFGCMTLTVSGVTPTQNPWVSAHFQVTANNVWFRGDDSGCTKIILANGATANIFTFGKSTPTTGAVVGGGVSFIEMDGNKANNTSGIDDTFQSGITIVQETATGATADSAITIERNRIHDFNHYGITTYGDFASGNRILNNLIYNNGKNDAQGTGDGIYINKGSSRNYLSGNHNYSNQRSGFRFTSAGVQQTDNSVIDNKSSLNGLDGFRFDEASNLGSIAAVGQRSLIVQANQAFLNAQLGFNVSTANNVGRIDYFIFNGNIARNNTIHGMQFVGNTSATSYTGRGIVNDNISVDNGNTGIVVTTTTLDIDLQDNIVLDNVSAQITTAGSTRTKDVGNKTNITDSTFAVAGVATIGGTATIGGVTQINATANPGLLVVRASGNTAGLSLDQTGVASWNINNAATTGTFRLTQGGSDRLQLDTSSNLTIGPNGNFTIGGTGRLQLGSEAFGSLGTPSNGAVIYCHNCDAPASPGAACTSAGAMAGAEAHRVRGGWICF